MDNIFVIAMIFSFFGVPPLFQHRVLFWGIMGALLLRGAMIAIGAKLIAEFHWIPYIFAFFLILTAVKMLLAEWLKLALGKHFMLFLLTLVLLILIAGVIASMLADRREINHQTAGESMLDK